MKPIFLCAVAVAGFLWIWFTLPSMPEPLGWTVVAAFALSPFLYLHRRAQHRLRFIDEPFPAHLRHKLVEHYPHLRPQDIDHVEQGLRQFFHACGEASGSYVFMPSKAADVLWHEFILNTREYSDFCKKAFGRFLHHTPRRGVPSGSLQDENHIEGLRRAWDGACRKEGIDAGTPSRLPLLFMLDQLLAIPDGSAYSLDSPEISACWKDHARRVAVGGGGCGGGGGGGGGGG